MRLERTTKTQEGKYYFIAMPHGVDGLRNNAFYFWSQLRNGKQQWTVKPGIGIHYNGGKKLNAAIRASKFPIFALLVPDNYAQLWKAKK